MVQVVNNGISFPGVNDLVRVTVGVSSEPGQAPHASDVPSRIEDVEHGPSGAPLRYWIAAPWFTGNLEPPEPGSECSLQWVTPSGLCWLPCLVTGQETTSTGLRMWLVQTNGEPGREQRRLFVRVPWAVTVELCVHRDLHALPTAVQERVTEAGLEKAMKDLPSDLFAEAANLSEGGMRCLSPVPQLPAGLPLHIRFALDHTQFDIDAYVVWSQLRPEAGAGRKVETAVAFEQPQKHGDALRPLLFAAQMRARRESNR